MKTNPRTMAVARAIDKARDRVMESSSEPSLERMNIALAQAAEKALIEALMEPSEEMLKIGNYVLADRDQRLTDQRGWVRLVWSEMLKAAGEGQ